MKLLGFIALSMMTMVPLHAIDDDPDAMYLITTPLLRNSEPPDEPMNPVNAVDVKAASATIPYPAIEGFFDLVQKDYKQLAADQKPHYLAPEDFACLKFLSKNHAKVFEQVRGPKVAFHIPRFEIFNPHFTFLRMLNVHILGDVTVPDLERLKTSGIKSLGDVQLTVDTPQTAEAFLTLMGPNKPNLHVHIRQLFYCGHVRPEALNDHITTISTPLKRRFSKAIVTLSFDNQGWLPHLFYPAQFAPEIQALQNLGIHIVNYHKVGIFWVCKEIPLSDFTRMMGSEQLAQTLHFLATLNKKYPHQLSRHGLLWALGEMTKFQTPEELSNALRFLHQSLELSGHVDLYPVLQLFRYESTYNTLGFETDSHKTLIQATRIFIEANASFRRDYDEKVRGNIVRWVMESLALWPPKQRVEIATIAGDVFKKVDPPFDQALYASHVHLCVSALHGLSPKSLDTVPARLKTFDERRGFHSDASHLLQFSPFIFIKWGHLFNNESLTEGEKTNFLRLFERIYDTYYFPSGTHYNNNDRYHSCSRASHGTVEIPIEPPKIYGSKRSQQREEFLRQMTGILKSCPSTKRMKLCADTYSDLNGKEDIDGKMILKAMKRQFHKI